MSIEGDGQIITTLSTASLVSVAAVNFEAAAAEIITVRAKTSAEITRVVAEDRWREYLTRYQSLQNKTRKETTQQS